MDARLHVSKILGLEEGDAHIIRNAGGVVTDDEIRSLAISQRLLGTREIVLIHHTDCGMLTFTDDEFRRQIQQETGIRPEWAAEAFSDLDDDMRQNLARIKASPFTPTRRACGGLYTRWGAAAYAKSPSLPARTYGRVLLRGLGGAGDPIGETR